MLHVTDAIRIPPDEFRWSFARSGGPGGQNVNKVASRAELRWRVGDSPSLPPAVKDRLRQQQRRRINAAGELIVRSQRFRDQERNRQDCLDKLRDLVRQAAVAPRPRRPTRPSRSSKEARLRTKRLRSVRKTGRRGPAED